jgi:putative hydrolase of the HAD superfamily
MPVRPPRAIIIDMDDTILAAGRRPEVLLRVAQDLRGDLSGHAPEMIADRLERAFAVFWSDPDRHREARFGVTKARRSVVREAFADLDGLSPELAEAFADRFSAAREAIAGLFPGRHRGS